MQINTLAASPNGELTHSQVREKVNEVIDHHNTEAHSHSNKSTLDATTATFTEAKDTKLSNLNERFRGIFADLATAVSENPNPQSGYYFKNLETLTLWIHNGTQWEDSGTNTSGDMLSSIYDPEAVNADVYDKANFSGYPVGEVFTAGVVKCQANGTAAPVLHGFKGLSPTVQVVDTNSATGWDKVTITLSGFTPAGYQYDMVYANPVGTEADNWLTLSGDVYRTDNPSSLDIDVFSVDNDSVSGDIATSDDQVVLVEIKGVLSLAT